MSSSDFYRILDDLITLCREEACDDPDRPPCQEFSLLLLAESCLFCGNVFGFDLREEEFGDAEVRPR